MPRLLHYSDIENVYDDPISAARLAGCVVGLNGPDALVVGTGDNTSPGVLALVEKGRQSLDFFDAVAADFDTFGNHDFDYGPEATRTVVRDAPQTWVSANVRDEAGDLFGREVGVVPHALRAVDGARVGLVGVTDPATNSLNPQATSLSFDDPVAAVADATATLRESGADYVVVLSHLGGGDDELASLDVDVVLGGHVHAEREAYLAGTLLTRPGANGAVVWEIDLDPADADRPVAHRHEAADASPVDSLRDALSGRIEAAGLDETVGHAARPIDRAQDVVFGGECRIGNFVADAYRWATGADVGLQNSGGIRAGPPLADAVTRADLVSVVPFEEHVVVAELTGDELRRAFAQCSAAVVDFGEPHWWHGHVSGADLVFDDGKRELVSARVGGDAVDVDATYTVATPEYVLHTDHEFPVVDERHRAGEFGVQYDVLAAYAGAAGIAPEIEGRIRRVR